MCLHEWCVDQTVSVPRLVASLQFHFSLFTFQIGFKEAHTSEPRIGGLSTMELYNVPGGVERAPRSKRDGSQGGTTKDDEGSDNDQVHLCMHF